jgi:hypothetical protein
MADALDQGTLLAGAKYRFGRAHPQPPKILLQEFRDFVRKFVREHLTPLDVLPEFEEYIQSSHYSERLKKYYTGIHEQHRDFPRHFSKHYKGFGKIECFRDQAKYKHVRCINPPPDHWKVIAGPLIHA